jgi:hypothetical protein
MSDSPSFFCKFRDGQTTRMTVFTSRVRLDVVRGLKLAQHAYRNRMKKEPPAIVEARFESNGTVLAKYTAEQIAKVVS